MVHNQIYFEGILSEAEPVLFKWLPDGEKDLRFIQRVMDFMNLVTIRKFIVVFVRDSGSDTFVLQEPFIFKIDV